MSKGSCEDRDAGSVSEAQETVIHELSVTAQAESISEIESFAEQYMEDIGVPSKILMRVNVAIDEIVSNIVQYSHASKISISLERSGNLIRVHFIDDGIPYDPSGQPSPRSISRQKTERWEGLEFIWCAI